MTDKKLTELVLLASGDIDWANDLIYVVDKSATTSGSKAIALADLLASVGCAVNISTINGIDYTPGADTDCTLVTVDVSGSPTMQWDESNDMFYFSKGLNTEGGLYVSNAAGTVNIATVNGIEYSPGSDSDCTIATVDVTGSPTIFWDESQDSFSLSHKLTAPNFRTDTSTGGVYTTRIGELVNTLGGTGRRNTFVGSDIAVNNAVDTDGSQVIGCDNVFVGCIIAESFTTGCRNVVAGSYALQAATSARANVAIGYRACTSVTVGNNNVGIGDGSYMSGTDGTNNTCVGIESGLATGNASLIRDTTCFGFHAGYGTANLSASSGSYSTWIGSNAGGAMRTGSTHDYSTALGYLAGFSGGANSLFIGFQAGRWATADNLFYLDALDRGSDAAAKTNGLMYGTFDATPASQTLSLNATVGIRYGCTVGTTLSVNNPVATTGTVNIASSALALTLRCGTTGYATWIKDSDSVIKGYIGYGDSGALLTGALAQSFSIRAVNAFHIGAGGDNLAITVDGSKNLGLGITSSGTNANTVLTIKNGTAPSSSVADTAAVYSADESEGNACLHTRTEGGAVVKLFQGVAVADATDAATTMARLNDLLARMRANGLIAT